MAGLRALLKLLALGAETSVGYAAVLVLGLCARLFAVRADGRPAVFQTWARCVSRTLGIDIDASGPMPVPPCLVVSNHLGYLDIVVLGTRVPAVFVAKSEVAAWPLLGHVCRAAGTLFVDRAHRRRLPALLHEVRHVLDAGGAVVVFPEGTSSDGRGVLPFHASTLAPVAGSGHRVYYATLVYETGAGQPPPERAVCWWGDMTLVGHLWGLLALPRITARLRFGLDPEGSSDRHALAARLHRLVSDAHQEIRADRSGTASTTPGVNPPRRGISGVLASRAPGRSPGCTTAASPD